MKRDEKKNVTIRSKELEILKNGPKKMKIDVLFCTNKFDYLPLDFQGDIYLTLENCTNSFSRELEDK